MTAAKKKDNVGGSSVQPPPVQPAPTPAPTATAKPETSKPEAKKEVQPSKQDMMLEKLKTAWTKRGVDLSKLTATADGKFLNIVVGEGWPTIRLGAGGGIELPEVRSYAKAFDAAVDGLAVFTKQKERDAKRAAAAQPKPPATPEQKKEVSKETTTAKKAKADAELERQLQQA